MGHKSVIGGTSYDISGGKTKVDGTTYEITGGKTKVDGATYNISFEWDGVVFANGVQHAGTLSFSISGGAVSGTTYYGTSGTELFITKTVTQQTITLPTGGSQNVAVPTTGVVKISGIDATGFTTVNFSLRNSASARVVLYAANSADRVTTTVSPGTTETTYSLSFSSLGTDEEIAVQYSFLAEATGTATCYCSKIWLE